MQPATSRTARCVLAATCIGTLCAGAAAPANAQVRPGAAGETWITLLAGGTAASRMQGVLVSDPLASAQSFQGNLAPQATASLSGALTYWISDGWGLRASGSWAPSRVELRLDDEARLALSGTGGEGGAPLELGDLSLFSAEVGAVFALPVTWARFLPYASVGAGALRYGFPGPTLSSGTPAIATIAATPRWMPAAFVAAGVVIPLANDELKLSFELMDHVGPTPLAVDAGSEAVRGHALSFSTVAAEDAVATMEADRVRLTSHFRVSAGFVFTIGGGAGSDQ